MNQISVNGELFDFPLRGPGGPDGNPIGTIINFLGTKAPLGYLVCAGQTLRISEYTELANFFKDQFGTITHFGEDGEGTFKLPDMRNLFLRGYHGDAEEQLSDEVGQKQEATKHPYIASGSVIAARKMTYPEDVDSSDDAVGGTHSQTQAESWQMFPSFFTSRPVNMAVLYCIKAFNRFEYNYTTEEQCIGTWIDRKPLYRRTFPNLKASGPNGQILSAQDGIDIVDTMVNSYGYVYLDGTKAFCPVPDEYCSFYYNKDLKRLCMNIDESKATYISSVICVTIEYTKTTDVPIG